MENIRVIFQSMPPAIKGMVVKTFDEEEWYTVVINSNISAEQQLLTYYHELQHVKAKDFASPLTVDELEKVRHM